MPAEFTEKEQETIDVWGLLVEEDGRIWQGFEGAVRAPGRKGCEHQWELSGDIEHTQGLTWGGYRTCVKCFRYEREITRKNLEYMR